MTKDEAMQMAFDALLESEPIDIRDAGAFDRSVSAMQALRTALAQPEQDLRRKRRLEKVQDAICANLMAVNSNSVESQPIKTQPEPEPVAWQYKTNFYMHDKDDGMRLTYSLGVAEVNAQLGSIEPLYTAPPQRKPLSNDEIEAILNDQNIAEMHQGNWLVLPYAYARAIEAAHGIKD